MGRYLLKNYKNIFLHAERTNASREIPNPKTPRLRLMEPEKKTFT
jgi:hypothetical protein